MSDVEPQAADGGALHHALLILLVPALVLLPVAFGGVIPWTWTLGFACVLTAGGVLLEHGRRTGRVLVPGGPVVLCAGLAVAILLLQLLPLPMPVLAAIAPKNAEAIERAVPGSWWQAASLDRGETLDAAMKGVMYLVAFWLAATLGRSARHGRIVLGLLLAVATFEVFYGLIEQFAGEGRIFGWEKPDGVVRSRASGTYVNPNHFAGLLAMALPVAVTLAGTTPTERAVLPVDARLRLAALLTDPSFPKRVLAGGAVALLGVGLAASLSRGGALAAGAGVVVAGLGLARTREVGGKVLVALTLLGAGALQVGGDAANRLLARFDRLGVEPDLNLSLAGRLSYAYDTLRMAFDHPLLGVGGGAFASAFERYESAKEPGFLPHAHNDYAQFMAEFGFVAFAGLGCAIWLAGWRAWRGAPRQGAERGTVALAALAGVAALAVHSAVDFNLRIPANALWGSVLLGLAWGAGDGEGLREASTLSNRGRAALLTTAVLLFGVGTAAGLQARADWQARPFVVRSRGDDRPMPVQLSAREAAVETWPFAAPLWGDLAALRWQSARAAVVRSAHEVALGLARGDEVLAAQVAETLVAARLTSDPELVTVADQALEEAERAVRLAPGDGRWTAVRSMVVGEAPSADRQ